MSTLRQIEANRRNSQKSTGPTSATGKAVSSMNSLKSGIHAKALLLPCENLAELQQLIEECYLHYHPANPEQRFYVDDLIRCEWTIRRLDNAETQTWRYQNEDRYSNPEKFPLGNSASLNPNSFSKLQYRFDATRRARARAILAIERLQAKAAAASALDPPAEPDPPLQRADPPSLPPPPPTTSPPNLLRSSNPTPTPRPPPPPTRRPSPTRPSSVPIPRLYPPHPKPLHPELASFRQPPSPPHPNRPPPSPPPNPSPIPPPPCPAS